jgi:hypothetical protein
VRKKLSRRIMKVPNKWVIYWRRTYTKSKLMLHSKEVSIEKKGNLRD